MKDIYEGSYFISSTFIDNTLDLYIPTVLTKINKSFIIRDGCSKSHFDIGTKLVRILKIMLNKYKFQPSKQRGLVIGNVSQKTESFMLSQFSNCLNKLNLKQLFIDFFDIYIEEKVFFGLSKNLPFRSPLGIENKLWAMCVLLQEDNSEPFSAIFNPNTGYEDSVHEYLINMIDLFNISLEL